MSAAFVCTAFSPPHTIPPFQIKYSQMLTNKKEIKIICLLILEGGMRWGKGILGECRRHFSLGIVEDNENIGIHFFY
jgi:hypothetical protein